VEAGRDDLAAAGCSVLVVTQAKAEVLTRFLARRGSAFPYVSDPDREAYRAFGLDRTGWLTFLRPKVVWGYLRGFFRGHLLRTPYRGEDVLQLGGDFVLDKFRRVVFAYPSADPTDRPSVASIRDALVTRQEPR
jgi:alkyl-hydroperoxide reductase/thiol specific antioxidant family protein